MNQKNSDTSWLDQAIIYQIYPRVYKYKDGKFSTLVDIANDLKRIVGLGINTIYLMPIYPIGRIIRKGVSGSPYAIYDHKAVDPNIVFLENIKNHTDKQVLNLTPEISRGLNLKNEQNYIDQQIQTLGRKQLKHLVKSAHAKGIRVIIDLVMGHFSPDNVLLNPDNPAKNGGFHPEWFFWENDQDDVKINSDFLSKNLPLPPTSEWSDTARMKYGSGEYEKNKPKYHNKKDQQAMWNYMKSIPAYWVKKFDIDGFRCDFAHWVPVNFWRELIAEVKQIKSSIVFIAEAYERMQKHLECGFDAIYGFEFYNQLKSLHQKIKNNDPYFELPFLSQKISWDKLSYGKNSQIPLLRYTENHDEARALSMYSSPEKTKAAFLLNLMLPGIPLLYAGQECGETIRPPLFEGDRGVDDFPEIDFERDLKLTNWYRQVLNIRKNNPALIKGDVVFAESDNKKIVGLARFWQEQVIIVAINFDDDNSSKQWANLNFDTDLLGLKKGQYELKDLLSQEKYVYNLEQIQNLTVGLRKGEAHVFEVRPLLRRQNYVTLPS